MSRGLSWFPGHMAAAMREMASSRVKQAHIVVEVRDARVPFSSACNAAAMSVVPARKRSLILMNKTDLSGLSPQTQDGIARRIREEQPDANVLFISAKSQHRTERDVLSVIRQQAAGLSRFSSTTRVVLIVGVPNVGKSTILNCIRRSSACKVAAQPGCTRIISEHKLPGLLLLDSPGILPPNIPDEVTAARLALTHAIPDHSVDKHDLVTYLLQCLKTLPAALGGLSSNVSNTETLLEEVARRRRFHLGNDGEWDVDRAASFLVAEYRAGNLGRLCLDPLDEFGVLPVERCRHPPRSSHC
ncbi:Mitochondrial GTPase 1 [Plasmodiophora brassicae]|uniref:Mitochondrial GTPase 1 n=1 Tax=Plasmodiophora brassicae TaxID=37360 RepID=A8E084_PLABS|nr:hypothetical protein [Plasmodiophora brassicae]CAM98714.1 hypothetical protein [Plasmodiophora brassicae]CEP01964.1 hypothetical protein PBRA_002229 [Plasmodiophora brassicae]SPQ98822.1 unnamed protein product [Plasmodiophora brassicae]